MVGDVAKLDMLNVYGLAIQCMVGDVAKLDMLNVHGLAIQWLVMWQSWICSMYMA